ncbi:Ig-like domain repeat protein [Silvibacterium sp.]|uniref:Ig-like domain repeat protein n=1 Tax=Silvibacterium sp. TaxID=1964179 RepID=UPI0039E3BB90
MLATFWSFCRRASRGVSPSLSLSLTSAAVLAGAMAIPPAQAQTSAAVTAQPAVRLTQPIVDSQLVTLKHTVHPLASAANDRGVVSDSLGLDRIQVVLKRSSSQEAALKQLIAQMHTKGSASYHKWLTPEQFGAQFGASDQDIATVEAWLQGKGFSVEKVNPGKLTLEISGNAGQFRTAFHTQIHKYVVNGETHYANASDPQIPAALAPVFGGFASLNNFRPKSQSKVLGKAAYDPKTDKATPQWTIGNSTSGYNFVVAPGDFAVQYDLNPLYTAGINGSGQTIGIINDSNINVALVNQFRTLFGLSANPPQVIIDGNDPGIDGINNPDGPNYDSVEAYLDVEWSGAVAPQATVDLVIAADTALESGLILAAEHAVYGNVAPVLSLSFGECEASLGSTNAFLSSLWEQAAAEGITVMVSSGDAGSAACDDDNTQYYAVEGQAVNGFGSTPYNVAVGGTDFYYSDYATGAASLANYWSQTPSNGTPATSLLSTIPEQPWNASQYGLNAYSYYNVTGGETTIAGGGGGASNAAVCAAGYDDDNDCLGAAVGYTKPSWQSGTGVPSDKVRDVPDVALFASSGSNYSYYAECYQDGDCQTGGSSVQITGIGGTSASAPAFAGIMALVNQKYGRQGQADFVLYPLATQFPASFHDVQNGTNSVPCNITSVTAGGYIYPPTNCIAVSSPLTATDPTYGSATEGQIGTGTTPEYNAGVGYDLASGLGSVDANALVTNWGSVSFTGTTVDLTAPTDGTSITHGTNVTFTGTVTPASGSSTPTGAVSIQTSSTTPLQAAQTYTTLSSGAFSDTINYLPGGTYDVWVNYGGDSTNASSASAKKSITVTPESSSLYYNVVTPDGNQYAALSSGASLPYGTTLILSGQAVPTTYYNQCIAPSSPPLTCGSMTYTVPTGSVSFSDSGTALGTSAVNAEGDAELYQPAWSVGSHSVTASYSGDASYNPSTGAAVAFSIVKATPSVFVTALNSSVAQGQSLTLQILVEGYGVGVAPTGTVSISGGPTGTPTSATLSATVDPFYGTTAGVATITIPTSAPTSARLSEPATGGRWLLGGEVAFASVLLLAIPARRRSWRNMLGMIVVALLVVTMTVGCGGSSSSSSGGSGGGSGGGSTGTTTGSYTVAVSYGGDTNYNSASGSLPITVTTASTLQTSTTSVTTTATTTSPTAAIGTTVTVTGTTGHAAPTGTVKIYTGSLSSTNYEEGGLVLLAEGTLVAGSGTTSTYTTNFSSQTLLQGANLLTVQYSGDTTYAPSSATLNLSNPLSDFSITSVPGTGTLNVTATNSFSGSVSLSCSSVTGVTCAITPNSITLGSSATSGSASIALTGATSGQVYNVLVTGSANSGTVVHTLSVPYTAP